MQRVGRPWAGLRRYDHDCGSCNEERRRCRTTHSRAYGRLCFVFGGRGAIRVVGGGGGTEGGGGGVSSLRVLRAAKNRFGSSEEVGVYKMSRDNGRLVPITDPTSFFLSTRQGRCRGMCDFCGVGGDTFDDCGGTGVGTVECGQRRRHLHFR